MKKHNFYAGPAILPEIVLKEAAQSIINFNNSELSLLEISHRSKGFEAVMDESESLVKELLGIGEEYAVLFLTGGASSQFFMIPMNILKDGEKAAYINTGVWASGAIKDVGCTIGAHLSLDVRGSPVLPSIAGISIIIHLDPSKFRTILRLPL